MTKRDAVLASFLPLLLLATAATASRRKALPSYDFSGQWTGAIVTPGQSFPASIDLTSTGATTFRVSGTVTGDATVPCSGRGKRRKKTVIRLSCGSTKAKLIGVLDRDANTIAGLAKLSKKGNHARGSFMLAKDNPAVCGNGVVEPGEACDDGNTLAGDGCSPTCTLEMVVNVAEMEPNDDAMQANAVPTLPALVHGAVTPSTDLDFFRIVITGPDLLLETFDGSGQGSCAVGTDTVLELRGPDGVTVLAQNDDGPLGTCSRLELHGVAPGIYFPCVRAFSGSVPAYTLLVVGP